MKISFINNYIQPQKPEAITDQAKPATIENKGMPQKSKVDSSEISSSHSASFDDKRLMVAKSSILYDVSVGSNPTKIAELKEAVDNGSYKISTNDLTETILKE